MNDEFVTCRVNPSVMLERLARLEGVILDEMKALMKILD